MESKETWWQIDVGYACFGISEINGVVNRAAPIGNWMIGKNINRVIDWVITKIGTILKVN